MADPAQQQQSSRTSSRRLESAIERIEEGLSQLYASADLKPPNRTRKRSLNEQVRLLIEQRRLRFDLFPPLLFFDPAWDMLLELYASQLEHRQVHISHFTTALSIPGTTTLRWLDKLEAEALIVRRDDARDARRVWIELSQYGRNLMDRYLQRASALYEEG